MFIRDWQQVECKEEKEGEREKEIEGGREETECIILLTLKLYKSVSFRTW